MEIKQDNIQVLNNSWFLSSPSKSHPRAIWCIPLLQPGFHCIWIVYAWFPRTRRCSDLSRENFSHLGISIRIGGHSSGWGGTDRRVLRWSWLLPTHTTRSAWNFSPRFPTARSRCGNAKSQSWEGVSRGVEVSFQHLLWAIAF